MAEATALEQALRELGRAVELPPAPDLAASVGRRLREETQQRSRRPLLARRPLALGLAVLALAAAAALAVPQTRAAILDLLRIGGATVERVPTLPEADRRGLAVPGRPVSLGEARRAAGFELRPPEEHDAVYLDASPAGGLVSFVDRGGRTVLTQFRGEAAPFVQKSAGPGTRIVPTRVDGGLGYWLAGREHVVIFRDRTGEIGERRIAGNVLLWDRDGITYRLEGAPTLERALELAAGLPEPNGP